MARVRAGAPCLARIGSVNTIVARRLLRLGLVTGVSLAAATGAVAILEHAFGVKNASATYLVAVVLAALLIGTGGAVVTAVGAAGLYNFLFTEPRYTFAIHDPGVLLCVVLLLFVGIVVGQLAALQRQRAEAATAREQEARALFGVSRSLATRDTLAEALAPDPRGPRGRGRPGAHLGGHRARPGGRGRWRPTPATGRPPAAPGRLRVLQRTPGDLPARWLLVQRPGVAGTGDAPLTPTASGSRRAGSRSARSGRRAPGPPASRTRSRRGSSPAQPTRSARRSRTTGRPTSPRAAEIARQSDALKSALLQSVSHDLRTPARHDPRGGRRPAPGQRPVGRGPAGERGRDRARGGVPQPAGDQPARPVPDRGRSPARPAATCSTSTTCWPGRSRACAAAWARARSRRTCARRRSRWTRCSWTRRWPTSSTTRSSTRPTGPGSWSRRATSPRTASLLTIEDDGGGRARRAAPAPVREVLPGARRAGAGPGTGPGSGWPWRVAWWRRPAGPSSPGASALGGLAVDIELPGPPGAAAATAHRGRRGPRDAPMRSARPPVIA